MLINKKKEENTKLKLRRRLKQNLTLYLTYPIGKFVKILICRAGYKRIGKNSSPKLKRGGGNN